MAQFTSVPSPRKKCCAGGWTISIGFALSSPLSFLIAAVALANGFTVVTSDTAHFAKIGVTAEDWNLSAEA